MHASSENLFRLMKHKRNGLTATPRTSELFFDFSFAVLLQDLKFTAIWLCFVVNRVWMKVWRRSFTTVKQRLMGFCISWRITLMSRFLFYLIWLNVDKFLFLFYFTWFHVLGFISLIACWKLCVLWFIYLVSCGKFGVYGLFLWFNVENYVFILYMVSCWKMCFRVHFLMSC